MSTWDDYFFADADVFDPLRVERSMPVEDGEAAWVETLCQEATSGPLLIDDDAGGEGVVVATLPDGRHVISLAMDAPMTGRQTSEANAQLICRSRHLLLRLLRDRAQWQREREELLARIHSLEAVLESADVALDSFARQATSGLPTQAR